MVPHIVIQISSTMTPYSGAGFDFREIVMINYESVPFLSEYQNRI